MIKHKFAVKNSQGEKLVCVEVLPTANPTHPLPVVILCHGFAYYKEEGGLFTELARRLAKQGYAIYYFDFSGCGESEGNYARTSLTKLVNDLKTVLAEVSSYPYIDANRLSLVGQSFGTNVCMAAQQLEIEGMVLCGSFADPHELLSSFFDNFDETKTAVERHDNGRETIIEPQFWADFKKYNLRKLVANYDCPILFVHGERDDTVPLAEGKDLMSFAKNPELFIVPDSNHNLQPNRDQALDKIADFFKRS